MYCKVHWVKYFTQWPGGRTPPQWLISAEQFLWKCVVTNKKYPQDGSSIPQNQYETGKHRQLNKSCLLTLHWKVRGKDYRQYLVCCDKSESCRLIPSQQLCCRCNFGWQKCVYTKTGCSANSPQEPAPILTPPHSPASFTLGAHLYSVVGGQTVSSQIAL